MDLTALISEAAQLLERRESLLDRIDDNELRSKMLEEQADACRADLDAQLEAREELDDTLDSLRDRITDHPDARAHEVLEIATRLDEALRYREEGEDDSEY